MEVMTKEEKKEVIQDWVYRGDVKYVTNLEAICKQYDLEWYDDILSPIEFNCCDRCGRLSPSDELYWVDCDDNPSEELMRGYDFEGAKVDYCALCDECVASLSVIGNHS